MSGGVDSSLAAYLLKEQGHQVTGFTLKLTATHQEQVEAAQRVAKKIGIPHQIVDITDIFERDIIIPFAREYSLGRTPNPCVRCNQFIKFGLLLDKVLNLGFDKLATGHYARIAHDERGYHMLKGVDPLKDQSYFLYSLRQRELERIIFPLGEMEKSDVRTLARQLGLPSNTHESQDICFLPNDDYTLLVSSLFPPEPGDIVDARDHILGKHKGLIYYTIGQRRHLGVCVGEPLYVLRLDSKNNCLIVGPLDGLDTNVVRIGQLSWVLGEFPIDTYGITARPRYRAKEARIKEMRREGLTSAIVLFDEKQRALAPGQSLVFYEGEEVIGGGIIEETF